jgi:glycine/D-amino acid oxidase-like deaminating enzyme
VIGPDPDLGGLFYATGYGRDGILIAPLVGEIVADLMVSGASEFAWHAFRPDRFSKVG